MCIYILCRYTIHPSTDTWWKINISCWTIKKLSFRDASASGTCPPEFQTSCKFSLPTVPETCELTEDDHVDDDHIAGDECNDSNKVYKQKITCWLKPANTSQALVGSQHQDAVTSPVEIHVNCDDKVDIDVDRLSKLMMMVSYLDLF